MSLLFQPEQTIESVLPKHVNDKRRKSLNKYTFLALIVYHIPAIAAILAKYYNLTCYQYVDILYYYILCLLIHSSFFVTILLKNQITTRFIRIMLYIEVMICMLFLTAFVYIMENHRYMILIASQLIFTFVFIQSRLIVSYIFVALATIDYLVVAYIGIIRMGQPGHFAEEVINILIFLPVSAFIGYMCSILQKQRKEIKHSRDQLEATHAELKTTHETLESYNKRMLDSLHYAQMIQRSLLPGIDRLKTESPDSLIIWMPKDIVGGDIFYTYTHSEKSIIALMDCTGHGIPGAFLTMIAYSEIRKIVLDQTCYDSAEILKRLNKAMKNALHKNGKQMINDGLDAAVVEVDHKNRCFRFSGARIPLFYIENNRPLMIKGDKQSIGYVDSNENHIFTNHTVSFMDHCMVYLKTDGYTDQLGGEERLRFGTKRFEKLISEIHNEPFSVQRKKILQTFFDHQGSNDQMDDVTVIGFRM